MIGLCAPNFYLEACYGTMFAYYEYYFGTILVPVVLIGIAQRGYQADMLHEWTSVEIRNRPSNQVSSGRAIIIFSPP